MKLRNFMKGLVVYILVGVALMGVLLAYSNKIEKIQNGEITMINQNQMDR